MSSCQQGELCLNHHERGAYSGAGSLMLKKMSHRLTYYITKCDSAVFTKVILCDIQLLKYMYFLKQLQHTFNKISPP